MPVYFCSVIQCELIIESKIKFDFN